MKYIVLLENHEIGRINNESELLDLMEILGLDSDNDIRIVEA